jgi:DNA-directed RNA polymerase subunit RPC12/RpoP
MQRYGAGTLNCARCGGAVAISAIASQVVCPYCGERLALAPHELVELERYRSQVREQLARADVEYSHAARWNYWYGDESRKRNNPWVGVLVVAGLIVPLVVVGIVSQALGASTKTLNAIMPIAWGVVMVTVLGSYFAWQFVGRSAPQKKSAPVAAAVFCPQCGAPHAFGAGAVLDRCRHCGAALLPDARAREHGRNQAESALFSAELERHRAERRGMAALSRMTVGNATPYIVLGSFLPMTLFGAIWATATALFGDSGEAPLGTVLAFWGLAIINLGLIALVYAFRSVRRQRWERFVALGIAPFGGTRLADVHGVVAWLDRHWAGGVPPTELFPGPYFAGAELVAQGYPVCLIVNPVGAAEDYPGFIAVRVGAWLAAPNERHPHAVSIGTWVSQLGATLTLERAGIVVRFDASALERVARGAGTELPQLIAAAAELAALLGASRTLPAHG